TPAGGTSPSRPRQPPAGTPSPVPGSTRPRSRASTNTPAFLAGGPPTQTLRVRGTAGPDRRRARTQVRGPAGNGRRPGVPARAGSGKPGPLRTAARMAGRGTGDRTGTQGRSTPDEVPGSRSRQDEPVQHIRLGRNHADPTDTIPRCWGTAHTLPPLQRVGAEHVDQRPDPLRPVAAGRGGPGSAAAPQPQCRGRR